MKEKDPNSAFITVVERFVTFIALLRAAFVT